MNVLRFPQRSRLKTWLSLGGLLAFTFVLGGCLPAGRYDVSAVVLESDGDPTPQPGARLGAGDRVPAGSGGVTLGLVPGTVATLGAGGELRVDRLCLLKQGAQMLGREVNLTLTTGALDLLIVAPDEAAPTTLRLQTPAGEIVAAPGCLARIRVGNSGVEGVCARGELLCAGKPLPAGHAVTFPGAPIPRLAAGDGVLQRELASLLERGAHMQTLDLQRQTQPADWHPVGR